MIRNQSQPNNLSSFTCSPSSNGQGFTISVEVNLTDGMDQDEAIKVATEVFDKAAEMAAKQEVSISRSHALVREDGTWMVGVQYVEGVIIQTVFIEHEHPHYVFSLQSGYFEVVIDPFASEVTYSF